MTDEWGAGKWNEDAEMQLDQLNSSSEATNQNPDWLIDRKQIKSRISLGISRRSLFIITTILILGLVAAGIAKNVSLSTSDEPIILLTTSKPNQTSYTGPPVISKGQLVVDSAADLKELTAEQDTIIIKTLNEDFINTYSFTIYENQNVKNLKIEGPISVKWLQFLLRKFLSITTININCDDLCSTDMTDLSGFSFKSVDYFGLSNFFRCKDISWINKSNFPKIKSLEITNSDLTEKNLKPIHTFLDRNRKSIRKILTNQCFICESCRLQEISYKNYRLNITVLASRESPKFIY